MGKNRGSELAREAQQWMLLSVASVFFCGSCVSVASTFLCYMAMQDARREALAEATTRLQWGKRFTVMGVLLGAAGVGVALLLRALD